MSGPGDDELVTLRSPDGSRVTQVPLSQAGSFLTQGFKEEAPDQEAARVGQSAREAQINPVESFGQAAGRTISVGATDAFQRAVGGDTAAQYMRDAETAHPTATTAGTITGAILPALLTSGESLAATLAEATPIGRAAALGSRIAELGEGAGTLGRIGAKVAGGAAEGGIIGAGQGVSEISQSDDPLTWEHAVSAISSNALFGGALGGATGLIGGTLEAGLGKAKRMIDKELAARSAQPAVDADLAGLDVKGLSKAKDAELANIEASRVPERQSIADDIGDFRKDLKQQKLWLATKDSDVEGANVIGKQTLKADRQLDGILDNPKALADRPQRALAALQQQEHALEQLASKSDELRASFAGDETGVRAATLDKVQPALEQNRALQRRIKDVVAEPTSARLKAIADAKDVLQTPARKSFLGDISPGTAAGGLVGHALGGGPVGAFLGAKAGDAITSFVTKKIAKVTVDQLRKTGEVVDAFSAGARKVTATAPPMASAVLGRVRFAPPDPNAPKPSKNAKTPTLVESFKARSEEIRSQTMYGPNGENVMRPEAREKMASQLDPIRHVAPVAADRMETIGARRIEYLSSQIPRKPDVMASMVGPDNWQPSDMEMRVFARKVMAIEHPETVERRLLDGSLTPDDVAAYVAVYQERAAYLGRQLMVGVASSKKAVPFSHRFALSMFTGRPCDPSLDPRILARTQGQFANEEGTEGGTRAPVPKPAFGSVRSDLATPSQQRESGMR